MLGNYRRVTGNECSREVSGGELLLALRSEKNQQHGRVQRGGLGGRTVGSSLTSAAHKNLKASTATPGVMEEPTLWRLDSFSEFCELENKAGFQLGDLKWRTLASTDTPYLHHFGRLQPLRSHQSPLFRRPHPPPPLFCLRPDHLSSIFYFFPPVVPAQPPSIVPTSIVCCTGAAVIAGYGGWF